MAPKTSPSVTMSEACQKLQACAARLHEASDELGRAIADCDAALKKLNLGVTGWVNVVQEENETNGDYWERGLGYAKVGGKWGIALSVWMLSSLWLPHREKTLKAREFSAAVSTVPSRQK